MTVFRHFPTKEALVLQDEYDPIVAATIRSRPSTEPALESILHAIIESFSRIPEHEIELARARTELIFMTPALQTGLWANTIATNGMLAQALKDRGGVPEDDELEVITAIASALFATTMLHWMRGGAQESIADLLVHRFEIGRKAFAPSATDTSPDT